MPAIDKLLPTSVIGSYATPSWLWTAIDEIKSGRYGVTDEKEAFDDAVNMAIRDQERAGVDIIKTARCAGICLSRTSMGA